MNEMLWLEFRCLALVCLDFLKTLTLSRHGLPLNLAWHSLHLSMLIFAGCTKTGDPFELKATPLSSTETIKLPEWNVRIEAMSGAMKPPFHYANGEDGKYFAILEALGGGVAVADFNSDERWDLCFAGGGVLEQDATMTAEPNAIYWNRGNWQFTSSQSGLPAQRVFSHGVATADFNNDGFPDILVTGYGGLQLLQNQGDGEFLDITDSCGLIDPSWSTSAAWGDLNADGYLDIYVAHYVNWSFSNNPPCTNQLEGIRDTCPPRTFEPLDDEVFLGNGNGQFAAAREKLGFSPGGSGLGVLIMDTDGDADLDVYVANDGLPNFLYENTGKSFIDISVSSGADRNERGLPDGSMGLEAGDFNGDLLPDIWVTNFENESMAFYCSLSRGFYQHSSHSAGISGIGASHVGWGIQLSDFDADGDEDVFIATGHALRHPMTTNRLQKPLLLQNNDSHFSKVVSSVGGYFSADHLARGVAGCDFDNNGVVDTAVSQIHEPAVILKCNSEHEANWVGMRLIGLNGTRDPIGARIVASTFGKQRLRMIKGGGSYLSTSDQRVLFHLPTAETHLILNITWPSGINQIVDVPAGEYYTILESRSPVRIPD
ncbi:MAG: CRTAC1 family protein [Planctomycetaceae bacterium]